MAAITPAMTIRNVKPIAVRNIMSTVNYSSPSSLHRMQILASFEPPKFRSGGRRRLWPRSRSGARYLPDDMGIPLERLLGLSDRLDAFFHAGVNFAITEFS